MKRSGGLGSLSHPVKGFDRPFIFRKRVLSLGWWQRMEAIEPLPKTQQRFVVQVLETVLAQQPTPSVQEP